MTPALSSAATVRAVVSGSGTRPILTDVAVAAPGAHQLQVSLRASGICHTDIHSIDWPGRHIMGHEGAGIVRAIGEGVLRFAPGDHVLLNWAISCGHCRPCVEGLPALCPIEAGLHGAHPLARPAPAPALEQGTRIGRMFNLGTMAEVMLVDEAAATPIPHGVDFAEACIVGCAVMTGVGSVWNIADVRPGQSVAVLGCGSVGVNIVQAAVAAGAAAIIAIDRSEDALQRARQFGATHLIHAGSDLNTVAAEVRAITGGGADAAFEATGALALAFVPLELIRMGGTAVQVSGFNAAAAIDRVALPPFLWNKRYIVALYGGCVPDRDFPRIFKLQRSGRLALASQITRRWSFDDALEALATAERDGGKHVLLCSSGA